MDPLIFSLVSCVVILSLIYIVKRQFWKQTMTERKTFRNIEVQTDTEQSTVCDKGTFTYIKQATKKFQVRPQVFNAATETEDIILDTEELYADLTLFSDIL